MIKIKHYSAGAKIGLTTPIPVEVVLAANLAPVDLNTLFICHPQAYQMVGEAETQGFPRTICAGVKGIYTALQHHPEVRAVIVACQGDCSYTQALGEVLEAQGREVIHFKFPYPKSREGLRQEIEALMHRLETDWEAVTRVQAQLA